jgi:trigger factor
MRKNMQVSIETTTGLERRLTVGIPAAQVDGEVEKRLKQATTTVRIDGFRKGKVPMKVVKQRYGAGVRQEVLGEVLNRSFQEAIQQENVKPAGQPSIEPTKMDEGSDIEFVATFEVYPEIELSDFAGFKIERPSAEVKDDDVVNMIDVLRKQQADWSDVERAAADGDRVNIDFDGTKDGEAFEGGKAEGQELVLGSKSMIPGFEDGVVGMSAGEEKTLSLTFPDDYQAEELQGAAVEFAVKANGVAEQVLPELNDEFFEKYGVADGGEDKFREEVKGNMDRELKNATKNKVKNQVMEALIGAHELSLPAALVAGEVDALRNQMLQQFGEAAQNIDARSMLPDEMFKEQAERRVSLGLIVGEVVKNAEIQVDAERVRGMVDEMASTYQEPEEVVNYYYNNPQLLAGVESAVLEDQVVDYILDKAEVSDVEANYDDVIKPDNQAE